MIKGMGLAAVCGLIMFGGCAAQRVVQMGPRGAAADSTFLAESLRVGMDVKVILVDGTVQKGLVRAFLREGLVVGKPGNFGWQEVVCPYDRIQRVEMPPAGGAASNVAGNIFAGMLMGVMLLLAAVSISLRNSGGGCS